MECLVFKQGEPKEEKYALYAEWFREVPPKIWRGVWEYLGEQPKEGTVLLKLLTKNVRLNEDDVVKSKVVIDALQLNVFVYATQTAVNIGIRDSYSDMIDLLDAAMRMGAKGIVFAIPQVGTVDIMTHNLLSISDLGYNIMLDTPEVNGRREIVRTHDEYLKLLKITGIKMAVDMANVLRSGYLPEKYVRHLESRAKHVGIIRDYGIPKPLTETPSITILRIVGRNWMSYHPSD